MSELLNFDPTKHQVTLGTLLVNDYGDGQKLKFQFPELRTITEGVDGKVSVNEKATRTTKITIRVLQNSPIAIALRAMASKGTRFPFMYANISSGGAGWYSAEAFFTKVPDEEIGEDTQTLEFEVVAPHCKPVL